MTHRASLLGRGYENAHLDSPRVRFRRALILCLMTVAAPGSAQILLGKRWVGRIALLVWLTLLAGVATLAFRAGRDRAEVLGWLTNPDYLLVARMSLIVGVVLWLALFADAWRLGRPMRLPRWRASLVMTLNATLAMAVLLATGFLAQLLDVQRDVVKTVFTATKKSSPLKGRYNILLVGSDSGTGRTGIRPDSLTVASIDSKTGRTVLVSLPRNLQNVPFSEGSPMRAIYPYGYNCGSTCLLNAVHTAASDRPDLYPDAEDPGLEATIDAVEGATDLKINYYVMINLRGFSSLVDALGGVTVNVGTRIAMFGSEDAWKQQYIEPGRQKLDGNESLWFARSRVQSDDYTRMGRQKCLMSAMLQELSPQKVVFNAQEIAKSGAELLTTNIPAKELGGFADLALRARDKKIISVSLVPPAVSTVSPDFEAIHQMIADAIAKSEGKQNRPAQAQTTEGSGETEVLVAPQTPETPDLSGRAANQADDLTTVC